MARLLVTIDGDAVPDAAAGGQVTIPVLVSNTGTAGSDDTAPELEITSPDGIAVSAFATAGDNLHRTQWFLAAAAPSGCTESASGTSCRLPPVAAGGTLTVNLTFDVASTVAGGTVTVRLGAESARFTVRVTAGILGLHLAGAGADEPLPAGRTVRRSLVADVQKTVTDPGVVRIPVRTGDLVVTGFPDNCVRSGPTISCEPADGTGYGEFALTALPAAAGAQRLPVAVAPHGAEPSLVEVRTGSGASLSAAARTPGSPLALDGAFGGQLVGDATLSCPALLNALPRNRADCLRMQANPYAVAQDVLVPDGAELVSAEVTWAIGVANQDGPDAARLLTPTGSTLLTARSRPLPADTSAADISGFQVTRVADVTDLVAGQKSVSMTLPADPAARPSRGQLAAWSLTLVWWFPAGDQDVLVRTSDTNTATGVASAPTPQTVVLAPDAGPVRQLFQVVWAADPSTYTLRGAIFGAAKRVEIGGTVIARSPGVLQAVTDPATLYNGPLNGMHNGTNTGLDIVVAGPGSGDGVVRYVSDAREYTVAGPSLIITDAAEVQAQVR